jgi:hypothetical protein
MVDAEYEGIVMRSMAQLGYHEVKELSAQMTPGVASMTLDRRMIDRPLLDALLRRWALSR